MAVFSLSKDIKELQEIIPQAIITAFMEDKFIKYECDLRHLKITPEQNDSYFEPIQKLFGKRLIERFTHHTGFFDVYVKYGHSFVNNDQSN